MKHEKRIFKIFKNALNFNSFLFPTPLYFKTLARLPMPIIRKILAIPFPQPNLPCKYKLLLLARCEISKGNALLLSRYELLPLARPDFLRVKSRHCTTINNYLGRGSDKFLYYDSVNHLELHNIDSKHTGKLITTLFRSTPSTTSKAAPPS